LFDLKQDKKEEEEDDTNLLINEDEEGVSLSPSEERKMTQLEVYSIIFQDCLDLNLITS